MAPPSLVHSRGALDVHWGQHHAMEAEWVERDQRRNLRRLARFQGQRPDGESSAPHPWLALGEGHLAPDGEKPMSPLPEARIATPASPMLMPGSSSRLRATPSPLPPRTASTSLSLLWRRALSTPSLPSTAASSRGISSSRRERRDAKRYESEAWFQTAAAADGLDQEALANLIEHVHSRILRERRRRKDVEVELGVAASSRTPSLAPSSELLARTPSRHQGALSVASRLPTPAR
mmetsp:Transcript_136293/g.236988  ORF Transcript_136293/g.236988 Transcript_136293/m.236988 type:complete len:235 (-) Transcript_136293:31-735(-)